MVFPSKTVAARLWHAKARHLRATLRQSKRKLLQKTTGQPSIVACHLASCRALQLQVLLEASTVSLVQQVSEANLQANMHPRVGIDKIYCCIPNCIVDRSLSEQRYYCEGTVELRVQLSGKILLKSGVPSLVCCLWSVDCIYANCDIASCSFLSNKGIVEQSSP